MKLVDIDAVTPSTYNPRHADPRRLDIIELSLRKLGFLLPLYASPDGELSSGHQRHHVAMRMGVTKVPVAYVPKMTLDERKAVNIAFNRGTNDLSTSDTPQNLTEALQRTSIYEIAEALPDKVLDGPDFYPCLQAKAVAIKPLLEANRGRWVQYATNISKTLRRRGVIMPLIVTPDLRVVNGIGRLQMQAEAKADTVQVVVISEEEAALADAMLNLLSMDFDIHTRYADLLRYNSFRRARRTRDYLGSGFTFAVIGNRPAKLFDITKTAHRKRWISEHGESILDFGAGHLTETEILRTIGLKVTPFEPYHMQGSQIDKEASLALTSFFLDEVANGTQWSSIFIASVLNSVPFEEDRRHIVRLVSALSSPYTKTYAVATKRGHPAYRHAKGKEFVNNNDHKMVSFLLNYEPGIKLGEIGAQPKVQKYHTNAEFERLFATAFDAVQVTELQDVVSAIASKPKPIDKVALREAIEFEFNLPYPDGTRMDLVEEALSAFSQRLGVDL